MKSTKELCIFLKEMLIKEQYEVFNTTDLTLRNKDMFFLITLDYYFKHYRK